MNEQQDVPGNIKKEFWEERKEILSAAQNNSEEAALQPGSPNAQSPEALSALCISGGGIRSATFGLGILQGLAEFGLLDQFDYLSTVSGGGYIGSWLTAWATRRGGLKQIVPELAGKTTPREGDPDPIQHLRNYNNYLTPRLGFSEDIWTMLATIVRNIFLNSLVLIPLLMLFLMAPRILLVIAQWGYQVQTLPAASAWAHRLPDILSITSSLLYAYAMFNLCYYLPGVGGRNHNRSDYLKRFLAPIVGSTLLYCAFDAKISAHNEHPYALVLLNIVVNALIWLAYVLTSFLKTERKRARRPMPVAGALALLGLWGGFSEWLISNRILKPDHTSLQTYVAFEPPILLASSFVALALFAGLSSGDLEDSDREWLSRACAGLLMFGIVWLGISFLVLMAPQWILKWKPWQGSALATAGAISGWIATRLGTDASGRMKSLALKAAPTVFIVALAIGLSAGAEIIICKLSGPRTPIGCCASFLSQPDQPSVAVSVAVIALTVLLALLSFLMARFININTFSLNAMYRDRLVRAYLGASNEDRLNDVKPKRWVEKGLNHFTGFAESDNLPMHKLIKRPFHVLNLTLNMTHGGPLAWQQRKARSFTVSPLHCGNSDMGYQPSKDYAGEITLGTAMSISGAAVSPSMGERSSTQFGFIMTLLNSRLGAWLGNPGPAGAKTWKLKGPDSAAASLLREAFGLTDCDSPYVYLSDGGHFDNLGLYEMILRRCRTIVVIDSGQDSEFSFEDLGNALRKIRIDHQVSIEFDEDAFRALREKKSRFALATIKYPESTPAQDGQLIYIKPLLMGNEPPDVISYANAHSTFPHESTADQWYDESQTESYRMLGRFTIHSIFHSAEHTGKSDAPGSPKRLWECLMRGVSAHGAGVPPVPGDGELQMRASRASSMDSLPLKREGANQHPA
jgi:hypothetical protein